MAKTEKTVRYKGFLKSSNNSKLLTNNSQPQEFSDEHEITKGDDQNLWCNSNKETSSSRGLDTASASKNTKLQCQSSASMELVVATKKYHIYLITSQDIIVKVLKSSNPLVQDVKHLDNEFMVGQKVSHPSFRLSIERTTVERKQALLLKWAPGSPVSELKRVTSMEFLPIAREIVSSLLALHAAYFTHADLTCEHIIFDAKSKSIKIISFGSSTNFSRKTNYITNNELLDKDLRCISPEQTGRINRYIDYRSDFYSLGVIFYRLLAGTYPFQSANALELINLHICQDPVPLHTIDPNIPVPLSAMVSKLMEKNADDRYQSTKGIMHDLDLMIAEHETDEKLASIELMQHDTPETLIIPQKLYDHSIHYITLLSSFNMVKESLETVFVSGDSGTGKTSLVFELYRPIAQKNGIFITGKYDFQKAEPYSALLEAVNNFCNDLLLRNETTVNRFKSEIRSAIGDEGKILTDVITSLHLVIGQQPFISDAFGQDAKNRFIYVFIKFIKAICSVGIPIVLVLDDLQWMDVESLGVLTALLKEKCIKNLMFIGIYRFNEVNDNSPIISLVQHLEKAETNLTRIKIDSMDHESINELISDTLYIPPLESYALTAMIYEKTKGNPFFINQYLKLLIEQELIFFCVISRRWKWDASLFGKNNIYEDVKELIRLKLLSYDEHTQLVFKVASCLGSPFSLRDLKLIVNRSDGIECALATNLIAQHKGSDTFYRFAHDHIQEAAFSLLPDNPKPIFVYIAQKLCTLLSKQELDENIFVVVHLFQNGIVLEEDVEERSDIAELFVQAGKKVMASTAFTQAFEYFEFGVRILGEDCWTAHYKLNLNLHNLAAKAAYCTSNYTRMNALLDQIFKKTVSALDVVQSYSLKIRHLNDKHMYDDAIQAGVHILHNLGEKIVDDKCQSINDADFEKITYSISEIFDKEVSEWKEMEGDTLLSVMMILNDMVNSCSAYNIQLFTSISSRMVQLSFQHGISKKYSPVAFCAFGTALCFKEDVRGYQFGQLSLKLLNNIKEKENIPWIYICFYGRIAPFFTSIHDTTAPFAKAYSISLDVGLDETSVFCANTYCMYSFLSGMPLLKLLEDIDVLKKLLPIKTKVFLCIYQAIHNLISDNESSGLVSGEYFNSMSCFDENEKDFDVARVSVMSSIVAYLLQNYTLALSFVDICKNHQKTILATYLHPMFLFYESLVLLSTTESDDKKNLMVNVNQNLDKLKRMSRNAPQNYANKIHLIEAEMSVKTGDNAIAKHNYQKAISLSNKHNFPQEEALSYERLGMCFWEEGQLDAANKYLIQAYGCYKTWGAKSKMHQLMHKYPSLSQRMKDSSEHVNTDLQVDMDNQSLSSFSLLSGSSSFTVSNTDQPKQKHLRLS